MELFKNITWVGCFLLCIQFQSFAMNLEQAKNQLSETKTYQIFDVLSPEEIKTLSTVKGSSVGIYDLNERCDIEHFKAFAKAMCDGSQINKKIVPILQKLCKNLSTIPNTTMVTPSILVQNKKCDTPTYWHIDQPYQCNKFVVPNDHADYRVLVNLQGEGTIFTELDSHQRGKFIDCMCQYPMFRNHDMVKFVQEAMPTGREQQLKPGQAVVFAMAEAVHTRPDTTNIIGQRALMKLDYKNDKKVKNTILKYDNKKATL